jgi:hypothetical protein
MEGGDVKRLLAVGAAAVAIAAGYAVTATGQGGPPTGTLVFDVHIPQAAFGVNCGNAPQRVCFRRPRLASVGAGNGTVHVDGRKVGDAVFANIVAKRLGRNNLVELFFATVVFDEGSTLSFQGASSNRSIPYSVTGGTGTYAGARGVATEADVPSGRREFRVTVTVTFT